MTSDTSRMTRRCRSVGSIPPVEASAGPTGVAGPWPTPMTIAAPTAMAQQASATLAQDTAGNLRDSVMGCYNPWFGAPDSRPRLDAGPRPIKYWRHAATFRGFATWVHSVSLPV